MARTRIGVDVGSTAVRVAEVAAGDIPVVVRAAQVPLPPGVVEAGEVRQPEAVAEALRELWSKSGVKSKQVHLGVGNQRVVVREVALPWLPEKELRDTLGFQVQEFIPMASDEAVLDFDPLGEMDQGGRRMVRILLVAAHKPMVNALVEAALAAKLDPQGIDLTPFAVIRAVGTGDEGLDLDSSGDEAIVDIGAQVTSICVHDRGVTRFVRMLPSGGRDITLALASGLGVDDDVAERLKRGESIEAPSARSSPPPASRRSSCRRPRTRCPSTVRPPTPCPSRRREACRPRSRIRPRSGSWRSPARGASSTRSGPRWSSTRPRCPTRRSAACSSSGEVPGSTGCSSCCRSACPVPVDRGRLFERAKSEIELSAEASAEAEAVLSVAVGLAIPARRNA